MKDGVVVNCDMEKVWHHTFYNELRRAPEDHRLMMSHSPCAPDSELEKTAQIMFETFNVPQISTVNAAVLSLFPSGCYTGVCLHLGETTQYCVPVRDACPVPHGSFFSPHGCNDVSLELKQLLAQENVLFCTTKAEHESATTRVPPCRATTSEHERHMQIYADIMQTMASVADGDSVPKKYVLPDGTEIPISHSARTRCTDVLFQTHDTDPSPPPSDVLLGISHAFLLLNILPYDVATHATVPSHFVPYDGVLEGLLVYAPGPKVRPWRGGFHDMLFTCLQYCASVEMSSLMPPRVVFCGGGSNLHGFAQRLQDDIVRRLECSEARVTCRPDGQYLKWVGGSIASSLPNFPAATREEYEENGPQVIHTKIDVLRPDKS